MRALATALLAHLTLFYGVAWNGGKPSATAGAWLFLSFSLAGVAGLLIILGE